MVNHRQQQQQKLNRRIQTSAKAAAAAAIDVFHLFRGLAFNVKIRAWRARPERTDKKRREREKRSSETKL